MDKRKVVAGGLGSLIVAASLGHGEQHIEHEWYVEVHAENLGQIVSTVTANGPVIVGSNRWTLRKEQ